MGRDRSPAIARGFTLLELIVTLAVLGIAIAVVTPAIGRGTDGLRTRAEVASFAATLRHARERAIATQRPFRVSIDGENHRISVVAPPTMTIGMSSTTSAVSPAPATTLSPSRSTSNKLETVRDAEVNETRALSPRLAVEALQAPEVVFDPRGTASGGDFRLTSGNVVYRVTVDRLTGRVKSERQSEPQ